MKLNVFLISFVASTFAIAEEQPQFAPEKIAQASQAQQVAANMDRTIAICHLMENPPTPPGTAVNSLSPIVALKTYFRVQERLVLEGASKATVLQNPAHGTLIDEGTLIRDGFNGPLRETGERSYSYQPAPGYLGQDSATLLVEMGGYKIKVIYSFHVLRGPIGDDTLDYERLCPNEVHRVSATSINVDDNGS